MNYGALISASMALLLAPLAALHAADDNVDRVTVVTKTRGLVAFWDFVKRE